VIGGPVVCGTTGPTDAPGRRRGPGVVGALGPALAHLRAADPVMAALIDRIGPDALGPRRRARPSDHWGVLIRAIVAQQVSVASADAIHARLLAYFGGRAPTPEELLAADPELMRPAAGLSRAKTVSLRSLAAHVVDGRLRLAELAGLGDDEVRRELCAVTGIGPWSADIFLIFHLGRPDLLAVGDVGIRNAMAAVYDLRRNPTPSEMEVIAAPWRPYRTVGCLYLWRSLDAAPLRGAG
jgi:DNA-3-methyladenine glycosylase II